MIPPGLIVSAPASGTGKTTVMLGLLAAFRAQGWWCSRSRAARITSTRPFTARLRGGLRSTWTAGR